MLDACKRVCLANGQGEQEKAAICMASMKMLGNFQVGKVTQERLIINRTFPGWTAIGVTRSRSYIWLHVLRENALLLHCYFRGFGD